MIGEVSILLIFIIILTILSIIWVIRSFQSGDEDIVVSSLLVLMLGVGLVGWGVIGSLSTVRGETIFYDQSDVIIEKTNSNILVITPMGTFLYDKKSDYDNINDSTLFLSDIDYNMYGISINTPKIFYYNKSKSKEHGSKIK